MELAKKDQVHNIFTSIASRYDLMNDLISLGRMHAWRKKAVRLANTQKGERVLDLATGTGDLAMCFKKVTGNQGEVLGTDFCQSMLDFAPAKAKRKNLDIKFELADATNLQYSNENFDITSIAYGIRNVDDLSKGLQEMNRVTKSQGGRVVILETGKSEVPLFKNVFNFYFAKIMPKIAGAISGDYKAYDYLNESSSTFPYGENFVNIMKQNGDYRSVQAYSLFGGVSYIYIGVKN